MNLIQGRGGREGGREVGGRDGRGGREGRKGGMTTVLYIF